MKNIKRSIIIGAISAAMSITTGTSAFAEVLSDSGSKTVVFKDRSEKFKETLDKLVKESKITEDQEKKILAYFKQKDSERQVEREKIKNMTEEQREAYFKANPRQKGDFFKELVSKGIINESQAQEIIKVLPHRNHHSPKEEHHGGKPNKESFH